MWPFETLGKRKYERRRKAALIVLLGAYMGESLAPALRARIESEMNECFNKSDAPSAAWRASATWDVLAAYRAAAMERCGIEPLVSALSWAELFKPWRQPPKWAQWPMRGFDFRPASLVLDFRAMDPATADAKAYLRSLGMHIPEADPSGRSNRSMQPTAGGG